MGLRLLPEAVRWNFNLGLRGAKCAVSVPDLGGGAERRRGGENGVHGVFGPSRAAHHKSARSVASWVLSMISRNLVMMEVIM